MIFAVSAAAAAKDGPAIGDLGGGFLRPKTHTERKQKLRYNAKYTRFRPLTGTPFFVPASRMNQTTDRGGTLLYALASRGNT